MRYEIRVALNDPERASEEALEAVVECAGEWFDSAGILEGVVTMDGSVSSPVMLSLIILRVRLLNWPNVKIERTE